MQVETGESSLDIRHEKWSVAYWINLQGHKSDHPTKSVIEGSWETINLTGTGFAWKVKEWAAGMSLNNI